ncbi:MAG TPA: type II toxin-antitoxin system RelE/ParE family toxin [Devosia sp.]|uniref:type II toxin-antitoxin system RelE/ParE family toxin n=1 Tax=Devosia sp. TaxID=1871048 RepID=UPI002DDD5CB1|nr:type II toxin-antitoxin system RelE/ParE family toxin [Devosia sp.]HEV2515378.1 type II toxin-antitoxin system RelE/ParE family toxin [Devosia sp.]
MPALKLAPRNGHNVREINWRPEAQAALYHFISYIADHDPAAARRMLSRILESVEPSRQHPNLGRIGRAPGTREIVAHPNYIVIYRTLPGVIEVLDVVHARQEYP